MSVSALSNASRVALVAAATIAAALVARKVMTKQSHHHHRSHISVTELWIYPVKSCRGIRKIAVTLNRNGFQYDREWAVVRKSDNAILTQRDVAVMALIETAIDEDAGTLTLTAPPQHKDTLRPLVVSLRDYGDETTETPIVMWKVAGAVRRVGGDAASAWLSAILGVECFLGRISKKRVPITSPNHATVSDAADVINIQDYSSLHIITEEGVNAIRQRTNDLTMDTRRFRPNIVLKGVPFSEEDFWLSFDIVAPQHDPYLLITTIRVAKLCGRCSVPTINPDNASRSDAYEPIRSLRVDRDMFYGHQIPLDLPGKQRWPMFGLNVFHSGEGMMRLGDRVTNITLVPSDSNRHN